MDLLIAAFPPELGPLLTAPPKGWIAACVGVGPVAAAAATTRLILEHHPGRVLFLGTCGAYDDRFQIGDLVSVLEVLDSTLSEARGEAYRPGIQVSRWDSGFRLPFPEAPVLATPAIACTEAGARDLGRLAPLEHLELAGVFEACRQAGVPVGAALAVANHVGPEAQAEWRRHHRGVSEALQGAVARLLA